MSVLLSLLSTVCACVPMMGFLGLVWWLDRYDREPIWLIGLTFLWGAIGGVVSAVVGSTLLQFVLALVFGLVQAATGMDTSPWLEPAGPVLIAPVAEEPAKALFLAYVIWNRHFDNMTDGFVYGAAAGLGFGMTENLLYFVGVSNDLAAWGMTVLVRTFYSALMHATATSIVGASLGFARFRGLPALGVALGVGLFLAGGVHATWNGLLTLAQISGGQWAALDYVLFPLELAGVFAVFQICLVEESMTIRRELQEEAAAGLIPADHPRILASAVRRLFGGWVPPGVDHELYVQTATSLAMRKRQVRQMGHRAPEFYRDEVDRLRDQVSLLLKP
ncbi:MAG: PrsW family intramembrane metalloprotease [Alphaproteobacteria bacterium]|nr:PrsW family intramembrane metalloprotease [Alphaproteobacteria bacterium]MCB9698190.1 PrsW family intramembrane metalloprotease [Alphaproteobacteria bacterium]